MLGCRRHRALPLAAAPMLKGTLFAGRYRIERRLGAGAMGAVYKAVDIETARPRALKVMHQHTLGHDGLHARFQTEATVTGSVGSPFLVDVINAGVDEATGTPFLVMELLRGEDLGQRLSRARRFDAIEAVGLLAQVALGLDAIHRHGVVHRDLKPSNLFAEARDPEPTRVKILDFGIAKVVREAGGRDSTAAAGTPYYMAPEQFRGGRVTPAADLYALGMIAFTLLVGVPYWDEDRRTDDDPIAFALVAARGPEEQASARAARHGVTLTPAFDAWFARATAFDPARRFPEACAAVRALAEALDVEAPDLLVEEAPAARGDAEPTRAMDTTAYATTELPTGAMGAMNATNATLDEAPTRSSTRTDASTADGDPRTTTLESVAPVRPDQGTAPDQSSSAGSIAAVGRPGLAKNRARPEVASAWRPRRAASSWWLPVVGVAVATFLGAVLGREHSPPGGMASAAASPLADPAAVIACPPLKAFGVEEPSGWLGAAAAATFCERARVILGGSAARTLMPAELLWLPVEPGDHYPVDPYDAADARGRAIEAASRRAAAYIDGQVTWSAGVFRLAIVLRRADGEEIAHSTGESRALYDAVRRAMDPLVEKSLLPSVSALDSVVAEYARARTVGDALRLLDLTLAISHNAGTLLDECSRVQERAEALVEMGLEERIRCAYTLGLRTPEVTLGPTDVSSRGAQVTHARITHMTRRADPPEVIDALGRAYVAETSSWGRSSIDAALSCLLQASDAARAADIAWRAVQAEPKNPTGGWCAPWAQLVTLKQGTSGAQGAARAMQAWEPWHGYGWLRESRLADGARALSLARRAYLLSPLDTHVADVLAKKLLADGAREEARGIALALLGGDHPVHQVASDLILMRVDASEARFGAALARAERAMLPVDEDAGWVRVQRLEIAWSALEIAIVLGRSREVADRIVAVFLDPEPTPLDGAHMDVPLRLPAICARASPEVSRRCFARLRALRGRLSGGILPGTEAFIAGAEAWAREDFASAARAFRQLLRDPATYAAVLPEAMIDAFERVNALEVAAELEAAEPDRARELSGASPAVVRAALRAAKEGRREEARALAQKVIQAWATADVEVPAVEQMRRIQGRIGALR